ncbi:dihydrofolate reductase [Pseudomonas sp. KU43P]|nr:dihydrofolate reductase [Pseudomonas sp. KU43P]
MFFAQAHRFGEPAFVQSSQCSHKVFHCTVQGRSITHTPGAILAGMNTSLPLSLIAAHAENRVIGIDNSMPWHLPGDFKYFKATTLGKPIIMGRKTWDSLGRPLPGRLNLVVSRQPGLQLAGAEVFASLEAALVRAEQWAREQGVDELMLIGGAQLYAQALEKGLVSRMYLTRVELAPDGDAWFPEFDQAQWRRVSTEAQVEVDKPAYHFEVWEKV